MEHIDVLGQKLSVGDKVIFAYRDDTSGAKLGCIYRLSGLAPLKQEVELEGCIGFHKSVNVLRVNTVIPNRPSVDWTADKIIELINSKPRSPRREEIIDVLEARIVLV